MVRCGAARFGSVRCGQGLHTPAATARGDVEVVNPSPEGGDGEEALQHSVDVARRPQVLESRRMPETSPFALTFETIHVTGCNPSNPRASHLSHSRAMRYYSQVHCAVTSRVAPNYLRGEFRRSLARSVGRAQFHHTPPSHRLTARTVACITPPLQ